ncbi:hypothetical protein TNCV_2200911 [Trichonephila clavipes]|nr:hypothetical protein TNCV_2200911 [Trichonephila clavipes]
MCTDCSSEPATPAHILQARFSKQSLPGVGLSESVRCHGTVKSWKGVVLNSRRTASHPEKLVEEEERWEFPAMPQGVSHKVRVEKSPNRIVTYMVLKATANNMRHLALCHDGFYGP